MAISIVAALKEGLMAMISHLGSHAFRGAGPFLPSGWRNAGDDSIGATSIGDGGTSTGLSRRR
jgi:hypothetical protein